MRVKFQVLKSHVAAKQLLAAVDLEAFAELFAGALQRVQAAR